MFALWARLTTSKTHIFQNVLISTHASSSPSTRMYMSACMFFRVGIWADGIMPSVVLFASPGSCDNDAELLRKVVSRYSLTDSGVKLCHKLKRQHAVGDDKMPPGRCFGAAVISDCHLFEHPGFSL